MTDYVIFHHDRRGSHQNRKPLNHCFRLLVLFFIDGALLLERTHLSLTLGHYGAKPKHLSIAIKKERMMVVTLRRNIF